MSNSRAWPAWRHYLDDLNEVTIHKIFDRLDWITGLPHEVFFEVFRREGILDIVTFLRERTDEEIEAHFRRYVTAPKAHEHYFMDLVYEEIERVFPYSDLYLRLHYHFRYTVYNEVRYLLLARRVLNATEALNLMTLQPWLMEELFEEVRKLPSYLTIQEEITKGKAIEEEANRRHDEFFKK